MLRNKKKDQYNVLTEFLNRTISDITGARKTAGDVFGLELEHEGRKLRNDAGGVSRPVSAAWSVHNDGSLRNNHGDAVEWVFKKPYDLAKSLAAVDVLFTFLRENNAEVVCSNRTSTHVHFNMSDKGVYQVLNTFFLFTIFEDILDTFCGEDRRGNLFCLSSRMAEGNLRILQNSLTRFYNFHDFSDAVRYSSINLSALNKFGTVEFRAMRGLDNAEAVKQWLNIINKLCTYGCYEVFNPVDLLVQVSVESPVGMLRRVFGEHAQPLIDCVGEDFVIQSVYEGVRLIQPLVYEVGNAFKGVQHRGPDFWAGLKAKKEPELADLDVFDEDDEDEDVLPAPDQQRARPLFPRPVIDPIEMDRINQEFAAVQQRVRAQQAADRARIEGREIRPREIRLDRANIRWVDQDGNPV